MQSQIKPQRVKSRHGGSSQATKSHIKPCRAKSNRGRAKSSRGGPGHDLLSDLLYKRLLPINLSSGQALCMTGILQSPKYQSPSCAVFSGKSFTGSLTYAGPCFRIGPNLEGRRSNSILCHHLTGAKVSTILFQNSFFFLALGTKAISAVMFSDALFQIYTVIIFILFSDFEEGDNVSKRVRLHQKWFQRS